jgi:molecular chaperone GrpE
MAKEEPTKSMGQVEADEAQQELDAVLDLVRRERAAFQNYKRRVEQERDETRAVAFGDLILRLLPALDDMNRAFSQLPKDLEGHSWVKGIGLGYRSLGDELSSLGGEWIGADGETFDPAIHEASTYEEQPGLEVPRVSQVVRPGFRLGSRLLRPAEVAVVGPSPKQVDSQPTGVNEPSIQPESRTNQTRTGGTSNAESNRN